MAKTGDTPKSKPKARTARPPRPSFTPAAAPAASSAWVYRSDAPAAAAARPTPPVGAAKAVKPAPQRRAAKAAERTGAAAAAPRASRVTHALDVVTLPIAVSLMAVFAPMRWLLGPSRR